MVTLLPTEESSKSSQVIEAICACVALSLGYSSLQEQQKEVVTN